MSLHTKTVYTCSLCCLNIVDKLYDSLCLTCIALIVIIVVELKLCRCILVGILESVDDVLVASVYLPPA